MRVVRDVDGHILSLPEGTFIEMKQPIVGYHQDEHGDWVADLACGHGQHVRHQPPMTNRPWVLTPDGRTAHLGQTLQCKQCEEGEQVTPPR